MTDTAADKPAIVFIHGIWMNGWELSWLRYKLSQAGFQTYLFHYHSVLNRPEKNIEKLSDFLKSLHEPKIHLVAHSMGGLLVNQFLTIHDESKIDRVVMMGSPINGSAVAQYLNHKTYAKFLLGHSGESGLLGDGPELQTSRPVCMIAGKKRLGIGMLLAGSVVSAESDGTVNIDETTDKKLLEHHVVDAGHVSMLWSKEVLEIIKKFLLQT